MCLTRFVTKAIQSHEAIYSRERPLKSSGSIQTAVFTLAPERYQKSLNSI